MWIKGVDIPDDLVFAHRDGKLVLFVGAGASVDSPSSLPLFGELAAKIAADGGESPDEAQRPPDLVLGDLHRSGKVHVHVRVAEIIGDRESQPNSLHAAICALAGAAPEVRIVTTNYDRHLSTALARRGAVPREYWAPALPMGNDFSGLVYLHGCVEDEPSRLVVTDRDFGTAYLTDAWAARFLERMFKRYVALFIGYSHNDPVMSYLARGLPESSVRYAFTGHPDDAHWRRLGITPIEYSPADDGCHDQLVSVVEKWAELAGMKLLDHEQRISEIVAAGPPQAPEETSYLEQVVADPVRVGFFTKLARGREWLDWVARRPEFSALFDGGGGSLRLAYAGQENAAEANDSAAPKAALLTCAEALAEWFAQCFVRDAQLTDVALALVRGQEGSVGPPLWEAIARGLHGAGTPRPRRLTPWVPVLLVDPPRETFSMLDYALIACEWPEDRAAAILLFDHLTCPRPGDSGSTGLRRGVEIKGSEYWLSRAWESLFVPNLEGVAGDLVPVVERHLRAAYLYARVARGEDRPHDFLALTRLSIEASGPDGSRDAFDCLVDAARDSLLALLRGDPNTGTAYLRAWAASGVPMLQRVAVHGCATREDLSPDEKIAWLVGSGLLFEPGLDPEVFRLIEIVLRGARREVADTLLQRVLEGPAPGVTHRERLVHTFLSWLVRCDPAWEAARTALLNLEVTHPELAASRQGPVTEEPPELSPGRLAERFAQSAEAALDLLVTYRGRSGPFEHPTWWDAVGCLEEVVVGDPEIGFAVLRQGQSVEPDGFVDLARAVIRAWTKTGLELDQSARAVGELCVAPRLSDVVDDVARFLLDAAGPAGRKPPKFEISEARALAERVWSCGTQTELAPDVDGWAGVALDHWAGRLAQFWIKSIAHEWRVAGDRWRGLSSETKAVLEIMLDGDEPRHRASKVIYGSQVHFFFQADEAWCASKVIPLLDVKAAGDGALLAWHGYLHWGRWDDRLLEAGLLRCFLSVLPGLQSLSENLKDSYCRRLAAITVQSETNPRDSGLLKQLTVGMDEAARTRWLEAVGHLLGELPPEVAERRWDTWMDAYWQDRLVSNPIKLAELEASALAGWVIRLDAHLPEAVALATRCPAGIGRSSGLLHSLLDAEQTVNRHAEPIAELVAHLLKYTQAPFCDGRLVEDLVRRLGQRLPREMLEPIVEQALRLGFGDASDWI